MDEKNFRPKIFRLRCPSLYKILFRFYSGENPISRQESGDVYVIFDIECNQNTLSNLATTHKIGPMKYE
jgi:hypothetical protein